MPTQPTFDPEEVLDEAMQLFWEQGYEATSASDLVDHLGIGRSSLYNTFGSKHELYLAALDRYREQADRGLEQLLETMDSPREAIRQTFEQFVESAEEDCRGCFLANATAERAGCDEAVRARTYDALENMHRTYAELVEGAQREGEIPGDRDPESLGRFLANAQYGLRVTARMDPPTEQLRDVVDTVMTALD